MVQPLLLIVSLRVEVGGRKGQTPTPEGGAAWCSSINGVRRGLAYQRRRLGLLRLGRRWRRERAAGGEDRRAGVHTHSTLHLAAAHLRPPLSIALLPLTTVRHTRHHAGHHARLHRHAGLHATLLLLHVLRVHLLGVALLGVALRRLAVARLLLLITLLLLLLAVLLVVALLAVALRLTVHRAAAAALTTERLVLL